MLHPSAITVDEAGLAEALKVQVPEGESGNVEVRRIKFTEHTLWPRPGERPPVGVYTEMLIDGEPWMSDFPCEVTEQIDFLHALNRAPRDSRILIFGLGLGVVLNGAMKMLHRGPIDVVEYSPDVLALVQPHYEELARIGEMDVRFHLASAYTWEPPDPDARWHIAWADIWGPLSEENLPHIARLEEKWGPLCLWLGSWSKREGEWLKGEREAGRRVPGIPAKPLPVP